MQPIHILIVDDEALARERVRRLLKDRQDIGEIVEAEDGRAAVRYLSDHSVDLVLLDIQMPYLSGFEVVESIGTENMPMVVFVTAFDRYALKAFEVHAVDYLLKPFEAARFHEALDHAIAKVRAGDTSAHTRRLGGLMANAPRPADHLDRLLVKERDTIRLIPVEDIDWIEAAGNYVTLHCGAASHLIRHTLSGISDRLDPARFIRIHRSTIINLDRVRDMRPTFSGEYQVRLTDGTELTLSRTYRNALKRFE